MTEIKSFRVDVPQSELDDLNTRLDLTRWPDQIPGAEWTYGVDKETLQEVVRYWRHEFDWRAQEARLNRFPQFTTVIDGQNVHFFHVRSENPDAMPLILTHGWPGSVAEFVGVIEPLLEDFHVVVPSIPGFGFSGPTAEAGWNSSRIARAWASLMARLGYERYGVHGNDSGSLISPWVGRVDPEHVVGVHVTQIFSFPSGDPAEMMGLTEEEQRRLGVLGKFWDEMSGFQKLQSTRPQNLAYALTDSPVGQLAWTMQLMWGDELDVDWVLTNVMIYWLTATAGSSARLYYEDAQLPASAEPTTFPVGLAMFPNDFQSIRRFAARDHKNIVHWSEFDRGGHYSGHDAPDLLVADLRKFFRSLA